MNELISWVQIASLADSSFLLINITNKIDGKFTQELYNKNLNFINRGKQSGDWEIGKNTDYKYVVLFFHERKFKRIFLGKKLREATDVGNNRFRVNVDQWLEIGITKYSVRKFCEGLKVSAQPVLIWRRQTSIDKSILSFNTPHEKSMQMHLKKYCRICWNTKNWQKPTGEASKIEKGSFAQKHGFGHEEWLFDWSKTLKGYLDNSTSYKYSFLQPINKIRAKNVNKSMDILLYTVNPEGYRFIVAEIRNAYVPDEKECRWVFEQYDKRGWLDEMKKDLHEIGSPVASIRYPDTPTDITNIKFRQEDITYFEPMIFVQGEHKLNSTHRYTALKWDDDSELLQPNQKPRFEPISENDPQRSEKLRIRKAVEGIEYNPNHVKIQNALFTYLQNKYGAHYVRYEENYVDISLIAENDKIFFEIKTAMTAKKCVREAIGQLLEYGHYADKNNATKFIVVGDVPHELDDETYMKNLRRLYNFPIFYQRWCWDSLKLSKEI